MLFRPLTDEIAARHVMELLDSERASRIAYYIRRYNMHNGIVTDPNEPGYDETLCKQFFPKGETEQTDQYQERMKHWVPLGTLIIKRLVSLALKGGVSYRFEAINEADAALAESATKSFEADLAYNNWESLFPEIIENALAIGEVSTWQGYRKYDPLSGEEFDNGGRIKLTIRYPWIAEPIVNPENVTEVIGSIAMYNVDSQVITPAVTARMNLSGSSKRVIELWLSSLYDVETGNRLFDGSFTRFENEKIITDSDKDKAWSDENFYGVDPTVHWFAPDPDETQYRGKSYHDRYADSWIKLCRVSSLSVSGVQYMINLWYIIASEEASPKRIDFRHNAAVSMGQGTPESRFGQTEQNLNLTENRELIKFLVNIIGQSAGYSAELLNGLEGSVGKAADSGIAMKILYEVTEDAVRTIRRKLTPTVKELMRKTLIVKEYESGFKGDIRKLKPVVVWDENIIPVDDMKQLEYDMALQDAGLRSEVDNVIKYNQHINTPEEAEKFISDRRLNTRANVTAAQPANPLETLLNGELR